MKSDPARKTRIVEAWKTGISQAEIARTEGVSRQAVSMVVANYQKLGDAFLSKKRGRTKVVPLTPAHIAAIRELLNHPDPGGDGIPGVGWPEKRIRVWFKSLYARTVTVHQIRQLRTDWDLFLPREHQVDDAFSTEEYPGDTVVRDRSPEPFDNDFPSLEEMKQALAQMRAQAAAAATPRPAKKKGLPFTKGKRRRR